MSPDSAQEIQFTVRCPEAGVAIVDIRGELRAESSDPLADAYARAAAEGVSAIVLSFRELQYMNSSGIGLIVTLLIRAKRNGQRVYACELSDHYRQIFEVTRLVEAINVFDTENQAISAARSARGR